MLLNCLTKVTIELKALRPLLVDLQVLDEFIVDEFVNHNIVENRSRVFTCGDSKVFDDSLKRRRFDCEKRISNFRTVRQLASEPFDAVTINKLLAFDCHPLGVT